jgi:NAD(P)-dependent dehydrogenase (short-subunit alcohol dehydrogenase family)
MNSTLFDFTGRDIWVFGGAGYLGQPTVELLAELGARVLCVDLPGRAEAFVSAKSLASSVRPASLDVADASATTTFVSGQLNQRGTPHGLVIMTYASTAKRLDDLTEADFDAANHGNLTATFLLAREVGNAMAARGGGSIVLFSSM